MRRWLVLGDHRESLLVLLWPVGWWKREEEKYSPGRGEGNCSQGSERGRGEAQPRGEKLTMRWWLAYARFVLVCGSGERCKCGQGVVSARWPSRAFACGLVQAGKHSRGGVSRAKEKQIRGEHLAGEEAYCALMAGARPLRVFHATGWLDDTMAGTGAEDLVHMRGGNGKGRCSDESKTTRIAIVDIRS